MGILPVLDVAGKMPALQEIFGYFFNWMSLMCCDRLGFPQELGAIASLNNLVGAIARINDRVPHPVNPKILDILIAKRGVSHFRQLMLR
ncbi:MAG: hypothetical protein AN488_19500 [Anabaena sp. WA113]|jgi:hypothetical protein|nr:MAG: hypothetical protein AN488_19500 [Anabaena sp. WA113]